MDRVNRPGARGGFLEREVGGKGRVGQVTGTGTGTGTGAATEPGQDKFPTVFGSNCHRS
ncbi:hypothetical protein [Micromonospora chersina]|uniref:hypothetical protein n=1 Tax=Micromonospora chersina TaxID=47854 RepID=UPI003714D9B5